MPGMNQPEPEREKTPAELAIEQELKGTMQSLQDRVRQHEEAKPINPEIELRFTYHPPKGNQVARYERLRNFAKSFAYVIDQACPESREKSLALTHLEDAVTCANAAIARRE